DLQQTVKFADQAYDIYYHIKISSILQEGFCFFMPNARRKSFEIYNF
ncbi:hypothetical protein Q604_UNBC18139G0001, partial [human gut metagenome]